MTMRVAYLGPRGSFAEAAARALLADTDVEFVASASVQVALDAARSGEVEAALVPIENSVLVLTWYAKPVAGVELPAFVVLPSRYNS